MGIHEDGEPAYVSWKQDFELGVSRIDTEHQFFFGLRNDLFAAVIRGQGEARVESVLDRLAAYADLHFAGEERDLERVECPGLPSHRAQHEMFRRNLQTIRRSSVRSRAMLDFMRDWLVLHILETDRRCVPWLLGAPVRPTPSPSRSAP
jgi:hemerythrin-like metal-binding protein